MGFRLFPIFIKMEKPIKDIDLLKAFELPHSQKGKSIDFYKTSKLNDRVFLGTYNDVAILCHGASVWKLIDDPNAFDLSNLGIKELVAVYWNETSDGYGFCYFKDGKPLRCVVSFDDEIKSILGSPVKEELAIPEEELIDEEEKEEILDMEGPAALDEYLKNMAVSYATNKIVERFIGTELLDIKAKIELFEYTEP